MAFPILGTPKPQFSDSSGSPLASGTLAVLEPTDDTNKASYPTADNADAGTSANSNPLTLDSRGEPSSGLFGKDGESYKLTLKDSTGTTIWTVDDINLPNFNPSGSPSIKTPRHDLGFVGQPLSIEIGIAAFTTGAHAALRDFTSTSTAAHALQLLETLVDDLVQKGTL